MHDRRRMKNIKKSRKVELFCFLKKKCKVKFSASSASSNLSSNHSQPPLTNTRQGLTQARKEPEHDYYAAQLIKLAANSLLMLLQECLPKQASCTSLQHVPAREITCKHMASWNATSFLNSSSTALTAENSTFSGQDPKQNLGISPGIWA